MKSWLPIQKTTMDVETEMRKNVLPKEAKQLRRRLRRLKDEAHRESKMHMSSNPMADIPNNIYAFLSSSLMYTFDLKGRNKETCEGRIVSHFSATKEAHENVLLYSIVKSSHPERETRRDLTYAAAISINAIVAQTIGLGKVFYFPQWFFIIDGITKVIETDPGSLSVKKIQQIVNERKRIKLTENFTLHEKMRVHFNNNKSTSSTQTF